jgi:hypothetical protein
MMERQDISGSEHVCIWQGEIVQQMDSSLYQVEYKKACMWHEQGS